MKISAVSAFAVACILVFGWCAARAEDPALRYFVEVKAPSLDAAKDLAAAGFDIAGIDRKTSTVGVVVTPEELARLEDFGWPITIRSNNLEPGAVAALADYTDPQELSTFMNNVVIAHPDLAKKITLKDTLFAGQKQYAVLITKDVGLANERPSFILDAQHHAREVMTPEIARDFIDYLTSNYATDAQVRRWVDNINIWVVGSVNPDGAMYVFTNDNFWRKNRHPSCAVDNNRNYPTLWGACNGSTASCASETTRGTAAGSEPETQGLMQLTSDVRPFFTLSYHTYGEYLMYPYGCNDPDELSALDEVAQGLNSILENDQGVTGQFQTGPIWSTIYLADGGSIDTQYNQYGAYSYVIEASSAASGGFQPNYATWRNITVQRQRTAWKYFLDKTLDGAQIRGTVTDAGTGLPLAANLSLQEVTLTHGEAPRHADANGHYHLLVHTDGTYHVSYSSPGYCTVVREVAVGTGPATMDAALVHPAVPQGVVAVGAGDNAIDISWQPAANAVQYRVLRSLSSGGPYASVGLVPAPQTSHHDATVSGIATYYYVVRAIQGCDSGNSQEAHAATTGACSVGPTFAGLSSVQDAAASTCTLNLTWPAAATRCGGSLTYRVYRSATSPFVPSPANLIASGLSGTSFTDHAALSNATPYFYIVRAVDTVNGADDGNTITVTGTPTGPASAGTWTDNAGDNGTARLTAAAPWSVLPTGGKTGPKVYATGDYGNNVCASLTTPAITLQSTSILSFASKYSLETDFDAGIVEIATGPTYGTWTKLTTVNYPNPLANDGNACGFPISGSNTVFSGSGSAPAYSASPYSGSLSAYDGQSVKLRWRVSSDGGVSSAGWWVDDISITHAAIPAACNAGTPPNPKEPSGDGGMLASRAPAGSGIELVYVPGCGTLDNAVYWGAGPIAGSVAWTHAACAINNTGRASFDPGDPAPNSFFYFVIVGQSATKESSYGTGTSGERAEAVGIGSCDKAQDLTGTCP